MIADLSESEMKDAGWPPLKAARMIRHELPPKAKRKRQYGFSLTDWHDQLINDWAESHTGGCRSEAIAQMIEIAFRRTY